MIYDGFLFFNEFDLLEIRLHELDSLVDKFIVCEANQTHSGKPKPFHFQENMDLFKPFLPKIIYVAVTDLPKAENPFEREWHQRNAILRGIPAGASLDDPLILSDVDEIPRASAVRAALPVFGPRVLEMRSYGGYMNARCGDWNYGKIAPIRDYQRMTPEKLRHDRSYKVVPDAGWHFSYVGGADRVAQKMSAFSHQEPDVQQWNNRARLEADLAKGIGVFGSPMTFEKLDDSFPEYLIKNRGKFEHLLYQA